MRTFINAALCFILILYNNINVSQIKQLNTAFTQRLCNIVGFINRSLTTLNYLNIHTLEKLIDSEHHSIRLNRTGFNTIKHNYNKKYYTENLFVVVILNA